MTAPARTMTPRPIARDRTLASRASDGSVYLIVYAPPANLSEVTVGRPPPIDREDLACNVRCRRGSQKHRHFTYFLRCPDPAHGRPAGEAFGVEHAPRGQHADELGLHVGGRDRVDPHTPRRPLDGHDLGHYEIYLSHQYLYSTTECGCIMVALPADWLQRSNSLDRRQQMERTGVTVREKGRDWYVFANFNGQRKARKIGPGATGKKAADKLAAQWEAALVLARGGDDQAATKIFAARPVPVVRTASP